jgi:hypothetical protein
VLQEFVEFLIRFPLNWYSVDLVAEWLALQNLHDDEWLALGFASVINRADIRMIERRSHARFSPKSLERLLVPHHFPGQELQRNMSFEICVFGSVHHYHAASPKLFEDAVMRDGPPYQN